MAKVEYRAVGKSYGAVRIMQNLSLDVADGEFVVLLGSSGCGKTTLLRMTAGLETISEGQIAIDGRVVNDMHPRDRNIAMVFQNYALYPTMKVRDNIGFSLEVAGLKPAEIARRVDEAARVLNIADYLDRYPKELSGGQRQRVAMGRAMVRDAKVFLFDEPLSNLDAKLRAHMRVEIRQLHDRLRATTIYVTHDQIEAMTMADKIVLMKGGVITQAGTPDDLYDRPNSRYVAEFIGSPGINCLDGQITADGAGATFDGAGVRLPLAPALAAQAGRRVTCGIRPTDAVIASDGPLQGKLALVERTGADVVLHLTVAGQDFVAVAPRDTPARVGETLALSVAPHKLHLFDAATGLRIDG